jgi:hypothetical protein
MRNFHRDFNALNDMYDKSIRTHNTEHQIVHESVTDDIASIHREGSRKQLRDALSKLSDVHVKDHSSMTIEDVCSEMKQFAEDSMGMTGSIPPNPIDQSPASSMHNPQVHTYASESIESEGTDGSEDDLTEFEKRRLKKTSTKEESSSGNIRAARTDKENEEADKEEADKESADEDEDSKSVGENFDKLLELLKLSDEVQLESDVVEEEMYDCIRDYMSDGYSRAEATRMCSGRGHEESSNTTRRSIEEETPDANSLNKAANNDGTLDANLIKTAKTLSGGQGRARMMSGDPEKKIQKSYGDLMNKVSSKLQKAVSKIK